MRGIIFAGDSFTWGQGLYFYSDLDNKNLSDIKFNNFNLSNITPAQIKYMESTRFARLVANEFNTFEVVKKYNGGTDYQSIEFIENTLGLKGEGDINRFLYPEQFKPMDFNFIIFQTSQSMRNPYKIIYDDKELIFENGVYNSSDSATFDIFYKWLKKSNISFDDWYNSFIISNITYIKNKLLFYESKFKIKTKLLCWTNEYFPHITNDTFLSNRLIKLNYNNLNFKSIIDLMEFESEFEISKNKKYFGNTPPNDNHSSLECHKIIANSIIENIKNTKNIL